jgi:peptidyl-prolyl cis-trans isomerase SurA
VRIRGQGWIVLAAGLAVLSGCKKVAAPDENVWGVVDGAPITRAEVDKYYRTQLNPDAPQPSQDEALSLKLNVLDELVNNHILLEKAKALGLQAADGEVEDKFTEFKSPYTEEEFQRQLRARNYTVDDLKNDIRQQLSIQKVINHEVVAKITVTDQDVQDFYNQNRAQFNVTETQYRIAQIVVTPHKDPGLRNRKNDDATTDAEARRKNRGARAAAQHRRGLRADRHGLFGRSADFRIGRRPGLRPGIVALAKRSRAEEGSACAEAGAD